MVNNSVHTHTHTHTDLPIFIYVVSITEYNPSTLHGSAY